MAARGPSAGCAGAWGLAFTEEPGGSLVDRVGESLAAAALADHEELVERTEMMELESALGLAQTWRLGIMGGTFDPIHIGHLAAASEVMGALALDEVVFVPAGNPCHKPDRDITAAEHRLAMVQLAVAANPRFTVSRVDVDRDGPTYTIDTLRDLRAERGGDVELFFITGADVVGRSPSGSRGPPRGARTPCGDAAASLLRRPQQVPVGAGTGALRERRRAAQHVIDAADAVGPAVMWQRHPRRGPPGTARRIQPRGERDRTGASVPAGSPPRRGGVPPHSPQPPLGDPTGAHTQRPQARLRRRVRTRRELHRLGRLVAGAFEAVLAKPLLAQLGGGRACGAWRLRSGLLRELLLALLAVRQSPDGGPGGGLHQPGRTLVDVQLPPLRHGPLPRFDPPRTYCASQVAERLAGMWMTPDYVEPSGQDLADAELLKAIHDEAGHGGFVDFLGAFEGTPRRLAGVLGTMAFLDAATARIKRNTRYKTGSSTRRSHARWSR